MDAKNARASRVELRSVRESDLDAFFAHDSDPRSAALAGVKPRTRAAFLEHWGRILADESITERAILADGELAGRVTCFEVGGEKTVGYWIAREQWGRGIATRALALLLEAPRRRVDDARRSSN